MGLKFDQHCVAKQMAPVWFAKYRSSLFAVYMLITSLLFAIYYQNLPRI